MKVQSHLISTDQPSRIYLHENILSISDTPMVILNPQIIVLTNDSEIKQADEGYYTLVETENIYFTKGVHLLQPFNTVKDHFNLFHPDRNSDKSSYVVLKIDKEVQNPEQYDNGNCYCNIKYLKKVIASSSKELTHGISEPLIQDIIKYYNEHKEMPEVELEECKEGKYKGDFMVVLSTNEVIGKVAWRNHESINETYERLGIDISDEPSVKKMYSREEVMELLKSFAKFHSFDWCNLVNEEWIEENLK